MKTIILTTIVITSLLAVVARPDDDWQQLTAVGGGAQSRLQPSHWPYDKHPNLPEITPRAKTTLLDVNGPGVVTLIHVSKYGGGDQDKLILRVWYDGEQAPAIEMPWLDFLGDVEAKSAHFSTVYFSHVKESHNFRLPMPFRKHIRMEVENPTDNKFLGYTDIQWDKVKALPTHTGCLRVVYRTGAPTIPAEIIEVCNIKGPGAIVAHWLQIKADHPGTVKSNLICEGNQELYLDGSETPQMEYLGTEDMYGFSWGMGGGIQSDSYAAIIRMDRWKAGGLFAMLRCRGTDKINFETSCRWVLDYQQEYFSALSKNPRHKPTPKESFAMPYRSAVYYYSAKP
jgi:hypothetical protein